MNTFRFLDFKVYKDAKTYYKKILVVSEKVKSYSFKDQIRRAVLSIILNIAEGSCQKIRCGICKIPGNFDCVFE